MFEYPVAATYTLCECANAILSEAKGQWGIISHEQEALTIPLIPQFHHPALFLILPSSSFLKCIHCEAPRLVLICPTLVIF